MIPFLQSSSGLNAGQSFVLPLSDAGAGIASLVPTSSLGSATPTFTRATTAYTRLSTGIWELVASGSPRSMYSAAGVYLGYWAEGARADVLGSTAAIRRTMSDAGWVVGATMTVGTSVGVDGVAAACALLTGGAVAATNTILFTTVLGSAARTYSIRVRRVTGTSPVNITDNGGTNWTVMSTTATELLFQVTRTQANPVVGVQVEGNGDQVAVDFNTIEAATFANPTPIPVNVSKAADLLLYPIAGNVNGTTGSTYAEVSSSYATRLSIFLADTAVNIDYSYASATNFLSVYDGTAVSSLTALTLSATVQKVATSWGGSVSAGAVGGVVTAGTFDGNMNIVGPLEIGASAQNVGSQMYGSIRNIRFYNRALSAAQLAALTT